MQVNKRLSSTKEFQISAKEVMDIQGYWIFLAFVSLSGFSIFLPVPWEIKIFLHVVWLRIFAFKSKRLLIASCMIYLLALLTVLWTEFRHFSTLSGQEKNFIITLSDFPEIDGNHFKSSAVTSEGREKVLLEYIIPDQNTQIELKKNFAPGTRCWAEGELIQPEKNRNEGLFNYQFYLEEENTHWILKVHSFGKCVQGKTGIMEKIKRLREIGIQHIEKYFPKQTIPYAEALIFGDRSGFSDEQYTEFQRLGVVHLLAISGLHVQIFAAGLLLVLLRLGITREAGRWVLSIVLPFYAVICGANPPVIRAVLMSVILLQSGNKKRGKINGLDALSISFLLFLLYNPYLLFNIGFQLSFSVSFAILISSRTILHRPKSLMIKMVYVALIAQFASLPILLSSFFQFPLLGLLFNLLFVPLFSYIVIPAFQIYFLLTFLCPSFLSPFSNLLSILIYFEEELVHILNVKWNIVITGRPEVVFLLILTAAILVLYVCWEKGKHRLKAFIFLLSIVMVLIFSHSISPYGEVTFIDIGQGDSILIQLPFNRGNYLIDTGGEVVFGEEGWKKKAHPFHVGTDILIPYLKSKGIRKIDKLILTHSDQDHIGAARELFKEVKVNCIYISPSSGEKPLMNETIHAALKENIPIKKIKSGFSWENSSGYFKVLSPLNDQYEGNNSSIVLFASFGGKTWLFTGDLEKEGEKKLLKAYSLHADILKVAHHGSETATSNEFIEQLHPEAAVISVGKNNRYGHPHQEVLNALESHHINVFRTDQMGAVHYCFFQNKGTFTTDLP